jgi:tetratricopeptide (TPR) repeat protein
VPFQWDEWTFIEENPIVKNTAYFISPESAEGLPAYPYFKTRYLGYLTFALNYRLGGLDVMGYHLFNFAVHVLNALRVYFLVVTTLSTPYLRNTRLADYSGRMALLTGLVFVAHPLQTEAVTYIFQRFASLSTFFCLFSLVAYARSRISEKWKIRICLYALSLVFAVMAMLTKEIAITLPLLIVLYDFLFLGDGIRKKSFYLVPVLLTMLIVPLLHINPEMGFAAALEGASRHGTDMPRSEYLFTQFRVIMTYLRLIFLPMNQNIEHNHPAYESFFELPVMLSFSFLAAIFFLSVYMVYFSRRAPSLRLAAFGILWFFVSLSVESTIIPLPMLISEYRIYLPSVGIFLATSVVAFLFIQNTGGGLKGAIAAVLVLLPIVLSYNAYARNSVWKSRTSLWQDTVSKSPGSARAHNNLGVAYKEEGQRNKAMEHYRAALVLEPDYARAHNNLGVAYKEEGHIDKAIEHYRAALMLEPDYTRAHNNLGVAYYHIGEVKSSERHFQHALRLNPDFAEAHLNLGIVYRDMGLNGKAVERFRNAIRLNPDLKNAHINLRMMSYEMGL